MNSENNSFSIITLKYWSSRRGEDSSNRVVKLVEPRSQKDTDFHVKELEKRSLIIVKKLSLGCLDTHKLDVI